MNAKYKETSQENTATPYSAILKLYGKRTKLTIYHVDVKKLLVKHNLISFFRYLEATTEYLVYSLQRQLRDNTGCRLSIKQEEMLALKDWKVAVPVSPG